MTFVLVKKLEETKPLTDIESFIDAQHWRADECLIAFDFDMTLSFLPIIALPSGKLVRSIKAELRGGQKTLETLQLLKKSNSHISISMSIFQFFSI